MTIMDLRIRTKGKFQILDIPEELISTEKVIDIKRAIEDLLSGSYTFIALNLAHIKGSDNNETLMEMITYCFNRIKKENGTLYIIGINSAEVRKLKDEDLLKRVEIFESSESFETFAEQKRDTADHLPAILIVEEENNITQILANQNYQIITENNSKSAMDRILAKNPELIILNNLDEKLKCIDFCQFLKSNKTTRNIPIIMLISFADTDNKIRGLELGVDDFLTNPINEWELKYKINSLFRVKIMNDELMTINAELENRVKARTEEIKNIEKQLYRTERLTSLGTIITGLTHELRNPISIISGHAQLLARKKDLDQEIKKGLEIFVNQTERCAQIIESTINLARSGAFVVKNREIKSIIDKAIDYANIILNNKMVNFQKDFDDNVTLRCDASQLEQVFLNIIMNAVDSVDENGVIKLKMRKIDRKVVITITDNGCGMDEDTKARVFDPFFTTKSPGKGTGLGMSIAYRIVESHQGIIEVESEPGKGCCFTITLPTLSMTGT